jgi:phosphate transport system protein
MQSFFETELAKLRKRIIKMFNLVDVQLDKASQSLMNQEFEYIDLALQNENRIDKLDLKIDKLCQKIFALAQPVATDLRFIMSSLRIGNEIERVADIALDIISRGETVKSYPAILEEYRVHELMADVIRINRKTIESYTNKNNDLAKEVIAETRITGDVCKNLFNEIISRMAEKSEVITIATDLILIIRDIERISGHLSNIAESVVFIVEGKRLRHAGLQSQDE